MLTDLSHIMFSISVLIWHTSFCPYSLRNWNIASGLLRYDCQLQKCICPPFISILLFIVSGNSYLVGRKNTSFIFNLILCDLRIYNIVFMKTRFSPKVFIFQYLWNLWFKQLWNKIGAVFANYVQLSTALLCMILYQNM